MYKILAIGEKIANIEDKNAVKYVGMEEVAKELRNNEYDFVYLNLDNMPIEMRIKKEIEIGIYEKYMSLPVMMRKLSINSDWKNTYINLKIKNKLLVKNIETIEYKGYEGVVLVYILEELLNDEPCRIKEICELVTIEMFGVVKASKLMKRVVCRNYSKNSLKQKLKYILFQKKINKNFFEKLLNNIKEDIEELEVP